MKMKKLILISIVLTIVLLLILSTIVVVELSPGNQIPARFVGSYADYKYYQIANHYPDTKLNVSNEYEITYKIFNISNYVNSNFSIGYENYTITSINKSNDTFTLQELFSHVFTYIYNGSGAFNNFTIIYIYNITDLNFINYNMFPSPPPTGVIGPPPPGGPAPPFVNNSILQSLNNGKAPTYFETPYGFSWIKLLYKNESVRANQQYSGPTGTYKVDLTSQVMIDSYSGIVVEQPAVAMWGNGTNRIYNFSLACSELINTNIPLSAPINYLLISIVTVVIAVPIIIIAIDRKKIFKKR